MFSELLRCYTFIGTLKQIYYVIVFGKVWFMYLYIYRH